MNKNPLRELEEDTSSCSEPTELVELDPVEFDSSYGLTVIVPTISNNS